MDYITFLFTTLHPCMGVLIILFNVVQIAVIVKRKKLRISIYHMNLALSDMVIGLVLVCTKLIYLLDQQSPSATLRDAMLVVRVFMVPLSLLQSLLSIVLLMLDRLLVIWRPITYRLMPMRQKFLACLFSWLLTLAVSLAVVCISQNVDTRFVTHILLITTGLILVIACFLYIWKRTNKGYISRNGSTIEERRFLRLCIKTFLLFLVCWLPYVVYGIVIFAGALKHRKDLHGILNISVYTLTFANSLFNPFIYLVYALRMRRLSRNRNHMDQDQERSSSMWLGRIGFAQRQGVESSLYYISTA